MTYNYYVSERNDIKKIEKLNKLNNIKTFYDDVRKLTKNVSSDHSIKHWQSLADVRYNELLTGVEDVLTNIEYDKESNKFTTRLLNPKTMEEVFPINNLD